MLPRALLCLILALATLPLHAAEDGREPAVEKPRRGMVSRFLDVFRGSPERRERRAAKRGKRAKGLQLDMIVSPLPLKLGETRQLGVQLQLSNRSKKLVDLAFPTTQRVEILIRDNAGKLVTQWSEDQAFANEAGFVAINPGERIEYRGSVATRDLKAGQEYVVEGFFPNFDALKVRQRIVPER